LVARSVAIGLALFVVTTSATAEDALVRFGVITRYHPRLIYQTHQPMVDYLSRVTPFRFELKLGRSFEETAEDLERGRTQIAVLSTLTYLEAQARFGAVALVRPRGEGGQALTRGAIITRADSGIATLEDLKGRTFAFAPAKSTAGNLLPRYLLFAAGVRLTDLQRYSNLANYDNVVLGVLRGQYDAGAVTDLVAERYRDRGLRIIALSDPAPSEPVVARPGISPQLVRSVREALLALDPGKPQDREILKDWDEEFRYGFIPATNEDYDGIRRMLEAIPRGCGVRCHYPRKGSSL
jgi:phosphonate transport system substrate-binding protein